jgi:hypothetical protein
MIDAPLFLHPQLIPRREFIVKVNYSKRSLTHVNLDVKCLLSSFNQNWNVLPDFSKNPKYEVSVFHVDGQT